MGNPVTRDYEVGKQVASAGPGLMWKVHQAVKKSTRQVRETGGECRGNTYLGRGVAESYFDPTKFTGCRLLKNPRFEPEMRSSL